MVAEKPLPRQRPRHSLPYLPSDAPAGAASGTIQIRRTHTRTGTTNHASVPRVIRPPRDGIGARGPTEFARDEGWRSHGQDQFRPPTGAVLPVPRAARDVTGRIGRRPHPDWGA